MKSSIQKQIYEETKNMSVNELLCYFNGSDMNLEVLVVKKGFHEKTRARKQSREGRRVIT
jgi:hypothetical protein